MRIAFVLDFFDERKGGAEAYLGAVARRLLAAGHTVELFGRAWRDLPAGVRGHRLPPPPLPRPFKQVLRPATELAFARAARARLRVAGYDVVLGIRNILFATHYQPHGGSRRAALVGIGEARGHALRRAWYWCDPVSALKEAVFLHIERTLLAGPARPRVLAVSEMVRSDFDRFNGVPPAACDVLYPGVDLGRYCPGGFLDDAALLRRYFAIPAGEVLLLFAGHNPSLKGLRVLLPALAQACAAGLRARLLVVGRLDLAPYLRQATHLGVADRVIFAGPISPWDMPTFFRGTDALVYPTFYDPCALVTLEALACGLPVVTTRRNGAAELMQDGREGFVIDHPRNVASLAARLHHLEDPGLRARMREAAAEIGKGLGFDAHFHRLVRLLAAGPGP
jgi:UDP-glucose:(heptosyl)LPS alpha-1,3-glucosyltransferase